MPFCTGHETTTCLRELNASQWMTTTSIFPNQQVFCCQDFKVNSLQQHKECHTSYFPGLQETHGHSTSRLEQDGAARKSKVTSSWREELKMSAGYTPAFVLRLGSSLKWICQEAVRLHQSQQSGANLALTVMILQLQPNGKTWPERLEGTH